MPRLDAEERRRLSLVGLEVAGSGLGKADHVQRSHLASAGQSVLERAVDEAESNQHSHVTSMHVLAALIEYDPSISQLLQAAGVEVEAVRDTMGNASA